MASDTHRCPIGGCDNRVRGDRLMCGRHWRLVPRDLQRAVYREWKGGAGRGTREHQEAMSAAIHAVEVKA